MSFTREPDARRSSAWWRVSCTIRAGGTAGRRKMTSENGFARVFPGALGVLRQGALRLVEW